MTLKKTKMWILSAAMTAGVAALPASFAYAKDSSRDREEWVKYEDVPRDVKRTLDNERGRNDIKRIDKVTRDGRTFYRAVLDTRGGQDTVIRVGDNGKLLSSQEINELDPRGENVDRGVQRDRSTSSDRSTRSDRAEHTSVRYNDLPARVKDTLDRERGNRDVKIIYEVHRGDRTYYNAIVDERDGDRSVRINTNGKLLSEKDLREVRTAGARYDSSSSDLRRGIEDDGNRIAYDRLPGQVKTTVGREAGQDRVGNVYEYDRRGQHIYEAEAYSPAGTRIIRVDENGRLRNDRDSTPEGRRSLNFNDLPGQVKESIGREAGSSKVGRVVQLNEGNHTYYRAQLDNGRGGSSSWVTVDENGRVVRDFDRAR